MIVKNEVTLCFARFQAPVKCTINFTFKDLPCNALKVTYKNIYFQLNYYYFNCVNCNIQGLGQAVQFTVHKVHIKNKINKLV